MKKLTVIFFSIGLLGISFYGLYDNSYYVQVLMNLDGYHMLARVAMVVTLMAYAFVNRIRLYATKVLLGASGIMLLSLGLVTLGSPTALSQASDYTLIGDSLSLIEGGILAIVLSAELPARRSRYIARTILYAKSLSVFARPKKLVPLHSVKLP